MNQDSLDEYIGLKGLLTIELVRDIIGLITASCAQAMEFEIIEYIMKGVIYEQKRIRPSFVQEILTASEQSKFKRNLEKYLNDNKLTIESYYRAMDKKTDKDHHHKPKHQYERIINLNHVDINDIHVYSTHKKKEVKVEKKSTLPLFKKKDDGILQEENLKFRSRILSITNNGI